MRALLSVKWKLIIAVVGVAFVCLCGMMLLNRRQAERYTVDRNRDILMEATVLNASLYNQAAGNIITIVGSVTAAIHSELEHARALGTVPDTSRIAAFIRSSLEEASTLLTGVGLIIEPGVLSADPAFSRFVNSEGGTAIKFTKSTGPISMRTPDSQRYITESAWWKTVAGSRGFVITEPRLDEHRVRGGDELHSECRFARPLIVDGRFVGAVWAEMCLSDFQRTLRQREEHRRYRESILISPEGATVGHPTGLDIRDIIEPSESEQSRLRTDPHPELMKAVAEQREFSEVARIGGRDFMVAVAPVHRTDLDRLWAVMLVHPVDEAIADSEATISRQLYEALGMLVVSVLLGYLVAHTMSRTIVTTEKWHRTIMDRVPMSLGILDIESRWIYANPAIAGVLAGGDPGALIGRSCLETMPEGDGSFVHSTNTPDADDIVSMEARIGDNRIHRVSSCRVLDTDGKYVGRLIIGIDVTDAKDIARTLQLASTISRSLDARSERILTAAQSLSDTAMEQSAAIEEITSTTQKIGEASSDYAVSARNSHAKAESTHQKSGKGATEAMEAAAAMNGVRDSGHKIRSIIKLIDDIAFQTSLLSLNAAVEAARAGRHGKGFAVVADEVRNLAQRSARAARETSAMIGEMTTRIEDATDSIEQLGSTLIDIKENAEDLRSDSDKVARLADEQSQSVHQVHISLEQISKSVDHTIVVSRETAAIAESIFQQAASLRRVTRDTAPAPRNPRAGRIIDLDEYSEHTGSAPRPGASAQLSGKGKK